MAIFAVLVDIRQSRIINRIVLKTERDKKRKIIRWKWNNRKINTKHIKIERFVSVYRIKCEIV